MPKNLVRPRNAEIANKMPTTKAALSPREQKRKTPGKTVASSQGSGMKEDTIDIVVTRNRKT
jgi:hypothetical protein